MYINYWIYMLPAMILMFATQWYVKSAYKKWSKVKKLQKYFWLRSCKSDDSQFWLIRYLS